MRSLKELFFLDPEVIFLNHGSFGATPRPVLAQYQAWQREMEHQPVQFLANELPSYLRKSRTQLGHYMNADADDLVFIPNATYGVNAISRSIRLKKGDEILASDHEYGACDKIWEYTCQKSGAQYIRQPLSLPAHSSQDILNEFWRGVTPSTKVIFLSHITSPTAICMPVHEICARARQSNILTLIDGAHAPGQIGIDLTSIDPDFYTGNCHKWMMAPKGSGFLYVRRDLQETIDPLIISWGWKADETFTTGSPYVDYFQWLGTHDPSAYLSVPAAIQFQEENDWQQVAQDCHQLLLQAISRITTLTGLPELVPLDSQLFAQMAAVQLPALKDPKILKSKLYTDYHIEIPCFTWNEKLLLRISIQGYNSQEDIDALIHALAQIL